MTQQFQSSKFLIEAGPVNWYEPHAKAVAERNAQEDQAKAENTAHLNQKLKVLKEEDPILKLAAISKTVQAAAKLTSAVAKKVKAQKDDEKKENETKSKDLRNRWGIGEEGNKAFAQVFTWDGPANKMFTEENEHWRKLLAPPKYNKKGDIISPAGMYHGPEYKDMVSEFKDLGPSMVMQLQADFSIKESARLSAPNAYENSPEWKTKYESGVTGALTPEDWSKIAGKPPGELEHKSWWYDRISAMGNSDELTKKYMGSELTRALATKKNVDLARASFRVDTKNEAIAASFLLTKANSPTPSDLLDTVWNQIVAGAVGLDDIKDANGNVISTALQQSAEIVRARFRKINRNGFVPLLSLTDLQNFTREHKGGKDGRANIIDAFFKGDKAVFNEIIQDNRIGNKRYLAVQSSLDNKYAAELLGQGGLGKMSKEDFDVAVLNLTSRGNLSAQTITALGRVNPDVQSRSIAESEQLRLDAVVSTGRTSNFDSEIAGFTQNSTIEAGNTVKQELKQFRSDLGVDTTSSEAGNNSDGFSKGAINDILQLKLEPLDHLSIGTQRTAQRLMSRIRDQEIGKQFIAAKKAGILNDKGALDLIASQVVVNVAKKWDDLGFDKKWGDKGAGPLSADVVSKSFPGLKDYHQALVEAGNESRIGSDETVVIQEAQAITNHIVKSGMDSALNAKGLIVKNPEFLALSKSIDPSGRITSWPPDILLKAEMIGVAPGVIAARQLEALLSSTDKGDQDYVKLHQLDKLTPILANYDQADAKYRQFLKDINDPFLPPGNLVSRITPNQFKRIMQFEQQIEAAHPQNQIKQALEDLKSLTHSDGTQLYEDEAIRDLFDQGAITFKNGKLLIYGEEPFSLQKK